MIIEYLKYITTKTNKTVKKSGILYESIAFWQRYKRNQQAWEYHNQNSKENIIRASNLCKNKDVVVILGSGFLIDVPINYLSDNFKKVFLIDIFHPKQIQKKIKNKNNIQLIEADLTAIIDSCINTTNDNLENLTYNIFNIENLKPDLTISANLISQLPITPINIMQKHNINYNIVNFANNIIASHLKMLENLPNIKCIITDKTRQIYDLKNNLLEEINLLFDQKITNYQNKWLWDIAPIGEISKKYSYKNLVLCKIIS